MRRADRLFQLVQLIRGRRLSTAAYLAERLQVSLRTVYRDVADLSTQGVPIEGEAGVGYRMRSGFDLPPLMFSAEEAKALVAAVRLAQPRIDVALSTHAENALSKILSVLPSSTRAAAESLAVYAPSYPLHDPMRIQLEAVRLATESHRKLKLLYRDLRDAESRRTVRPLGCFYWGKVWTLGAWCERRGDFRNFRVDRIVELEVLEERFSDEPGRMLADLFRAVEHETCVDVAQPGLSRS